MSEGGILYILLCFPLFFPFLFFYTTHIQLKPFNTFSPFYKPNNNFNPISQWILSRTLPTLSQKQPNRPSLELPRKPISVRCCRFVFVMILTFVTEVAKDSDASLGTRASAAKDALGDKASESKHDVCLAF